MIVDDGGMVCFAIGDYLDGYGKKVMGTAPASPLRHVRSAHRRKGLVRMNLVLRLLKARQRAATDCDTRRASACSRFSPSRR